MKSRLLNDINNHGNDYLFLFSGLPTHIAGFSPVGCKANRLTLRDIFCLITRIQFTDSSQKLLLGMFTDILLSFRKWAEQGRLLEVIYFD